MPWTRLALSPTDDLKAIKRAYAKQLKHNKPDEKPEEFKALYQAYKQALNLAKQSATTQRPRFTPPSPLMAEEQRIQQKEQTIACDLASAWAVETPPTQTKFASQAPEPSAEPTTNNNDHQASSLSLEPMEPAAPEKSIAEDAEQQQQLTAILQQIDCVLASKEDLNQSRHWLFLHNNPCLLDNRINQRISAHLFAAILVRQSDPQRPPFSAKTLHWLAPLFNWQGNQDALYQQYTSLQCQQLLALINTPPSETLRISGGELISDVRSHQQQQQQARSQAKREAYLNQPFAGRLRRLLAFIIDLCVAFNLVNIPSVLYLNLSHEGELILMNSAAFLLLLPSYFIMAALMEASPLQATPAKRMLGIYVCNTQLQRLGLGHSLLRMLVLLLCILLLKITALLFLFMPRQSVHDRFSRCYVLRR